CSCPCSCPSAPADCGHPARIGGRTGVERHKAQVNSATSPGAGRAPRQGDPSPRRCRGSRLPATPRSGSVSGSQKRAAARRLRPKREGTMKRPRIAGVVACAGVLSAVLAFGGDPASARELIYSSAIPAKHPLHEFGLKQYFENVTKDTGGSLTFELFPGGTLASAKTTLNAVRTGSVDMGLLADIYNPNDLPVS